jgi:hypothetical protein
MWQVWRERNGRNFDELKISIERVKSQFFETLFYWMSLNSDRPSNMYDNRCLVLLMLVGT